MRKTELYEFLISNEFRLLKQKKSEYFGDYMDLFECTAFGLRFIGAKSHESVDIYSLKEENEVFDLALVKALIFDETMLNVPISRDEYYQFIKDKLYEIKDLFSDLRYSETKKKLEDLGNERARQMFPGLTS